MVDPRPELVPIVLLPVAACGGARRSGSFATWRPARGSGNWTVCHWFNGDRTLVRPIKAANFPQTANQRPKQWHFSRSTKNNEPTGSRALIPQPIEQHRFRGLNGV